MPLRKEKVSDEEIQFLASMILSHLLCHLVVSFSRSLVKNQKNSSLFQRAIHMLGWTYRVIYGLFLFNYKALTKPNIAAFSVSKALFVISIAG